MRTPIFGSVTGLVMLTSACADEAPPTGPRDSGGEPRTAMAGSPVSRGRVKTIDDHFAALVERVPGFGGLFYDATGTLNLYLTDTTRRIVAAPAIAEFLDLHGATLSGGADAAVMIVHKAEYDFRALLGWHDKLIGQLDVFGMTSMDVDEVSNRITVGVLDAEVAARVSDAIAKTEVPFEAVIVTVEEPMIVQQTLQEHYRPVIGGLQIATGSGAVCTFGFNAFPYVAGGGVDSSTTYFVTNSHCTGTFGQSTGEAAGQPNLSYTMAFEAVDPPLFTHANDPVCPSIWQGQTPYCRYSDASLFAMTGAVGSAWHGTIAGTYDRDITITDSWSIVRTANHSGHFFVGQQAFKVGRTTGQTWGTVTDLCIGEPVYDVDINNNIYFTGRWLICQYRANYYAQGGDSGSPVFSQYDGPYYPYEGPYYRPVKLLGIHWAANAEGTIAVFSSFYQLSSEISSAGGFLGLKVDRSPEPI